MANVIVTDGDPPEITPQVLDLFILGRQVGRDTKHLELHQECRDWPWGRVVSR